MSTRSVKKRKKKKSGLLKLAFEAFLPLGVLAIVTIAILQFHSDSDYSPTPQLGAAMPVNAGNTTNLNPLMQEKLRISALQQVDYGIEFRIRNGWCADIDNIELKNEVYGSIGKFSDAVDFRTRSIDRSYERKTLGQRLPAIVAEVQYTCLKKRQAKSHQVITYIITAIDEENETQRCNTSQPERSNLKAYINFCNFVAYN